MSKLVDNTPARSNGGGGWGWGFRLYQKAFEAREFSVPTHVSGGDEKSEGEKKWRTTRGQTKHPHTLDSHRCNAKNADASRHGRPIYKECLPTSYCNVNNKTHEQSWRKSFLLEVARNPSTHAANGVAISSSAPHQ